MNLAYIAGFLILILVFSFIAYWFNASRNPTEELSEKAKARSSLEEVQTTVLKLAEEVDKLKDGDALLTIPFTGNWSVNSKENTITVETKSNVSNIASGIGWVLVNQTESGKVAVYAKSEIVSDGFLISYRLKLSGITLKSDNYATNPRILNIREKEGVVSIIFIS
jgi:cell division protein FtsB